MFRITLCLFAFCCAFTHGRSEFSRVDARKTPSDLRKAIFANYDSKVIPMVNGQTVPVNVGFLPNYITELDEEKELIIVEAFLTLNWTVESLTWNPNDFDGIKSLNVPSEDLWIPDISVYTGSPDNKLFPGVYTNAIIYNNGQVLWVPPMTVNSRCTLDYKHYPYDEQTCLIILGSWTFGSHSILFNLASETIDLTYYQDSNPNWKLISVNIVKNDKIYPCCPDEEYSSANVTMKIKRIYPTELRVAFNMSIMTVILSLVMFLMPAYSSQKVVVGTLVEVLLGVVMLYLGVVVKAPAAKYIACDQIFQFMKLVAGFILAEVIVLVIANRRGPSRPPRCIMAMCQLFEFRFSKPEDAKNEATAKEEWQSVATAVDRLMFFVLLIMSFIFYRWC